jgi:hypothetical protein
MALLFGTAIPDIDGGAGEMHSLIGALRKRAIPIGNRAAPF